MSKLKTFVRAVRQELGRISLSIKQMEFKILRIQGASRKYLREELMELKRIKEAIAARLSKLTKEARLHAPTMESIREDIAMLHDRCRTLKTQHL